MTGGKPRHDYRPVDSKQALLTQGVSHDGPRGEILTVHPVYRKSVSIPQLALRHQLSHQTLWKWKSSERVSESLWSYHQ